MHPMVTRITRVIIPNQRGFATTSANVSRGDVRMPQALAARPLPRAGVATGVVESLIVCTFRRGGGTGGAPGLLGGRRGRP